MQMLNDLYKKSQSCIQCPGSPQNLKSRVAFDKKNPKTCGYVTFFTPHKKKVYSRSSGHVLYRKFSWGPPHKNFLLYRFPIFTDFADRLVSATMGVVTSCKKTSCA